MSRRFRFLAAALTALTLVVGSVPAVAQSQGQDKKDMKAEKQKIKKRKHESGKRLLGDRIKKDGRQKLEDHGKFSADADVSHGKVRGIHVRHKDRGDVPVTKYKTDKDMSNARLDLPGGIHLAQNVIVTLWIGFAYVDDYGEEIIFWFPVDMVEGGDYGAVYYYDDPLYYG